MDQLETTYKSDEVKDEFKAETSTNLPGQKEEDSLLLDSKDAEAPPFYSQHTDIPGELKADGGSASTSSDDDSCSRPDSDDSNDSDLESSDSEKDSDSNQFKNKTLNLGDDDSHPILRHNVEKKKEDIYDKIRNNNVHEEIDLLKEAAETPEDLYELLATDPEYYLGIVENYKEENLQNLFNLKINRDTGKMMIKFKIYPEDRWTEVGYFNETCDDQETLEEFTKHVEVQLNKPRKPRPKKGEKLTVDQILDLGGNRAHLDYEIGEGNDIQESNYKDTKDGKERPSINDLMSQRNQNTLSSLAKQNAKRQQQKQSQQQENNVDTKDQEQFNREFNQMWEQQQQLEHQRRQLEKQQQPQQIQQQNRASKPNQRQLHNSWKKDLDKYMSNNRLDDESETGNDLNPSSDSLLNAYLNQILSKIASHIPEWLELTKISTADQQVSPNTLLPGNQDAKYFGLIAKLQENYQECPVFLRPKYLALIERVKNPPNRRFLQKLTDLETSVPRELLPDFYGFVNQVSTAKGADNVFQPLFEPDFSHDNICRKLNLSENDRQLLKTYGVNLLHSWNSYVSKKIVN